MCIILKKNQHVHRHNLTNPEGLDNLNVQNFIYNTLICKIFHMLYKWRIKWKKNHLV